MLPNAEYTIDGVDGEEAICGGLITKVTAKKKWMLPNAEYTIDGVDGEEAICGGLITKVTAKKKVEV